jgi:hypothetical protein
MLNVFIRRKKRPQRKNRKATLFPSLTWNVMRGQVTRVAGTRKGSKNMIMYKPLKSDPDQYDIECDVRERVRIYKFGEGWWNITETAETIPEGFGIPIWPR